MKKRRDTSFIDLTCDELDPPPAKRAKTSLGVGESSSHLAGTAARWKFDPSSQADKETWDSHAAADDLARKRRHEQFKMKLLADNSIFIRRKPDGEDNACATSMDKFEGTSDEGSSDDRDDAFRALTAAFSSKPKGKASGSAGGKPRAAPTGRNKVPEVGPSGQTYTPLELQVCSLC
jgi:DNA mismatch repair protein MSH3